MQSGNKRRDTNLNSLTHGGLVTAAPYVRGFVLVCLSYFLAALPPNFVSGIITYQSTVRYQHVMFIQGLVNAAPYVLGFVLVSPSHVTGACVSAHVCFGSISSPNPGCNIIIFHGGRSYMWGSSNDGGLCVVVLCCSSRHAKTQAA